MNYREFSEKSGLTYGLNRINGVVFVSFFDSYGRKVFEISKELDTTLFKLYDFRSAVFMNQSLVIEFLSKENQNDWFSCYKEPNLIEVYGIKLTRQEAETLYDKLSKQLKKEV
ncbi:hypothetical protein [Apilactobacillus kunkeei]|uniref:hypothetical protein n=1 Tax=Apilactobacillus kunkeei TaxID=148814 RepID=UPI0006C4F00C|nr:hypothetical protein [Apilactobacillus kunkeei]KOY73937.1 hypothetical protein RZ70_00570 [Apilactobacillus kunkeei]TPR53181.1 hypothetical protein DY036_07070 [Apilactobacillus kunkeei]